MSEEIKRKRKVEMELQNVRVRVQVSKTVQIPKWEPYKIEMGMEADVAASTVTESKAAMEKIFTEMHNSVMDAAEAYLEDNK